jgi:uncharacterized repeat protein (TIGR03803 family)
VGHIKMILSFNTGPARWLLGCGLVAAVAIPAAGAHDARKQNNGPDTVLHSFAGGPSDGSFPVATLLADPSGIFYGTAEYGGTNDLGAVFALAPGGTESVLYSFAGGASDGAYPAANLIEDASGNLYGTTIEGGPGQCSEDGCGTVFEISSGGTESVLYSFVGLADGAGPQGGLIRDPAGNLYGTTYAGGVSSVGSINCEGGCGTVFELSPNGNGGWSESVLYSFVAGKDGAGPLGGLVLDTAGNLYGTTSLGGGSINCTGGCGTAFEVSPTGNGGWTEKVIYPFRGGGAGYNPSSTLYLSGQGDLYGTTPEGGSVRCGGGCGLVFKLIPVKGGWSQVKVRSFPAGADGAFPVGNLAADGTGNIYGTTEGAGLYNCGMAYKISATGTETALHSFTGTPNDGCMPFGGLVTGQPNLLYGTTPSGGATNNGVIFQLSE